MPSAYRYEVDGELPPIMTPDEFAAATGGTLSATTETVDWALGAYSDAIRRQCGWHVAPSLACAYVADGGRLIRLPAMSVSSVDSVSVGGEAVDPECYEWSQDGLVRFVRPCAALRAGWRGVTVRYVAGSDAMGALQSTLVALVSEFLVGHPGISSQTAGGTQVSYSAQQGVMAHSAELAPYRLVT
ncbi:hypothetical protein [Olsenella phocaeensis]|uniref:hypothetical protein n=1 Tax=Olsenella phocaeensis TaxID=1852385 RepID=UPI00092FF264|nr:hypothetical protein [Olsenella phocaeensis]